MILKSLSRQGILLIVLIGLLFACGAPTSGTVPTVPPLTSQPMTLSTPVSTTPTANALDKKVDVGGRGLHLVCVGAGRPTVILEAGLDATVQRWSLVQPKVGAFTHVCAYDRANLGQSDPAPTPRTSEEIVRDLHTLLANAHIQAPYVLVGHSIGGTIARVYASKYRDEVVGMVLVDSTHPDFFARMRALMPPETSNESQAIKEVREYLRNTALNDEGLDQDKSFELERGIKSLGDLPLVVVAAGKRYDWSPGFPIDVGEKIENDWRELQKDLTKLSPNSSIVIAKNSGHIIPEDQPEIVIDAIRQVVDMVRRQTR
jgi:pimeloyl-ACP methyl ester carboxylesterase